MSKLLDKIIEAKSIMGDKAAEIIAEGYPLEEWDERRMVAKSIFNKHDNTPSMAWNKKDLYFKDFSTGKTFGIIDYYMYKYNENYIKAAKRLLDETKVSYSPSLFAYSDDSKTDFFKNYLYPKEETRKICGVAKEYLNRRGISDATMEYTDLRCDSNNNIAFQLRDCNGRILAVKYRPSHKLKSGEPKMFWQKNASNCPSLYNMDKCDITKPLLVVEGFPDCLSCIEAGYTNVVSIPGGAEDDNWIQFNYDWLECFDEIILWFDNDNAGQQGLNKVVARLGEYRCKIAKPTEDHEDAVEAYYQTYGAEGVRKTDANNVLLASGANAVLSIISSAEYPPAKNLKFLMDCSPVNISDIEKCSTGLSALDGVLYGNLFPCFTIYSGYAGSGKSSLANVATIISAIETGHKVFVFSGELSEGQLLDWIMSPLCGPNHIKEIKSKDYQRAFYYPTQQAEERVKKFYHDNIILYSSSDELDTSGEGIMNAMTMAYKRYGCDVFLIDNLMCISFENTGEDSKWDSQKKFIIKLMNFTNQYNVCTNLVLHPKKPSPGQNTVASVYDLHGASEIGNLCHRLIWVSRGASTGNDIIGKVKIDVVKDRPSQAAGSQCEIFYDKRTRRLFSNEEELYKEYSWEKTGSLIQYRPEDASKLLCNLAKVQIPYTEEEPY